MKMMPSSEGVERFALHERLASDSVFVIDLPLCHVRLQNQAVVPWLVLVPRREGVEELTDLAVADRGILIEETALAVRAVTTLFAPIKVNVGALGNIVRQFHMHVVGRFQDDPAWPGPVWGALPTAPYAEADLTQRLANLSAFFRATV